MMITKILSIFSGRRTHVLVLGALCVVGSFAAGIETAGDIQPIAPLGAKLIVEAGDVDGNGIVDIRDVEDILEIAEGYLVPSPQQLQADPNGDGQLTIDDALSVLHRLSSL